MRADLVARKTCEKNHLVKCSSGLRYYLNPIALAPFKQALSGKNEEEYVQSQAQQSKMTTYITMQKIMIT